MTIISKIFHVTKSIQNYLILNVLIEIHMFGILHFLGLITFALETSKKSFLGDLKLRIRLIKIFSLLKKFKNSIFLDKRYL